MKIFRTFMEWWEYAFSSIKTMCIGLAKVLWSIVLGLVSIMAAVWRAVKAFCGREPKASIVIGFLYLLGAAGWLGTFMKERRERVYAEYQRDSIALKLDSAKQNAYVRIAESKETE